MDLVAKRLNLSFFETPTGWKFFGNLMDSKELGGNVYTPFICGTSDSHFPRWHLFEGSSPVSYAVIHLQASLAPVSDVVVHVCGVACR